MRKTWPGYEMGGRDMKSDSGLALTWLKRPVRSFLAAAACLLLMPLAATAQENDQSPAEQLANPISSLISVPFQYNYDDCYGPSDGERHTLNIQPVIPKGISPNWNLITRTILPVVGFTSPAPSATASSA